MKSLESPILENRFREAAADLELEAIQDVLHISRRAVCQYLLGEREAPEHYIRTLEEYRQRLHDASLPVDQEPEMPPKTSVVEELQQTEVIHMRFRMAADQLNLPRTRIAKILDISASTLRAYMRGKRPPPEKYIQVLNSWRESEAAALIAEPRELPDKAPEATEELYEPRTFRQRFRIAVERLNLPHGEIGSMIGVTEQSVREYLTGKRPPPEKYVEAVENYNPGNAVKLEVLPETRQPEVLRMITVRLPKSLHESLIREAHENYTTLNKLCIAKLRKPSEKIVEAVDNCNPGEAVMLEVLPETRQPEVLRVITVRLPQSLHESLNGETDESHPSLNKLCIAKLRKPFVGAVLSEGIQASA